MENRKNLLKKIEKLKKEIALLKRGNNIPDEFAKLPFVLKAVVRREINVDIYINDIDDEAKCKTIYTIERHIHDKYPNIPIGFNIWGPRSYQDYLDTEKAIKRGYN